MRTINLKLCRHQQEVNAVQVEILSLPEVKHIKPVIHGDQRGFFMEAWNRKRFEELGLPTEFVQLNHSSSGSHILRGMHFQLKRPQGKLVRVIRGRVFDVAVDIRPESRNFGKWCGLKLDAENPSWLWVPQGFAHGFCVLSELAEFEYLCTDYYDASDEANFRWNDRDVNIAWPIDEPILSQRDAHAPPLKDLLPMIQAGA